MKEINKIIMSMCLVLAAFSMTACSNKSIIISGESSKSNAEATLLAQEQIGRYEKLGCIARSIGSGAGTGVGVGLGKGLIIGDDCPECKHLKDKQSELVEKRENTFIVTVLMECPSDVHATNTSNL